MLVLLLLLIQRAVASGLRHWVVVKPRENSLTLLDLRHPPG